MKKIVTVEDAKRLLLEIQLKIRKNRLLFLKTRKNCRTLAKLGIMANRVGEIIDELEGIDYCSGPYPDEKYPWKSVSIFGTTFRGIDLYIKLSVGKGANAVVCLSFHEPEWPMTFKFK
jgi:hypothetical protein